MSIQKNGSAVWQGGLKDGKGTVSTQSGTLSEAPYSFAKRFEDEAGANPEELIGAAHASCYSMALSMILGEAGYTPERIASRASVTLAPDDSGFSISAIHLETRASVPGADEAAFQDAAEKAKAGCPVSKLFNAEITLDARLD
ncbi:MULTISPECIES: OsmC family protein [Halomonas]|uniref:Osmotically inducible protein OsmC n=1 Tax=Halomonas halophila TaxID=29573 RepID=A0ABQ0U7T7_9GAMM|nr:MULTISPECIES: OsmC family protein [Halomonas]MDR5891067.1 OsmC family protein [Halomonas salina]RAH38374.1 OsmC family peroxiredoxin [Halomonas sp. SL1]WJY08326.1 OsmC family protein [Halomonas halophila]GEK74587.1 osmotically inducible protein OsmC [Halomonas halophila]